MLGLLRHLPVLLALVIGLSLGALARFGSGGEASPTPVVQIRTASQRPGGVATERESKAAPEPVSSTEHAETGQPLFHPLVRERDRERRSGEPSPPVPPRSPDSPPPVSTGPRPESRPLPTEFPSDEPEAEDLQLVGIVRRGVRMQALLRNARTGSSRYVGEGDEAWGFRTAQVDGGMAVVEREGVSHVLRVSHQTHPIELLGAGGYTAEELRKHRLPGLPEKLQAAALRLLPREGELRQVRSGTDDGQPYWEVEKEIDGREYELRIRADGNVYRMRSEHRLDAVPANIRKAAEGALPGSAPNPDGVHREMLFRGQHFWEVEVVAAETGRKSSVRMSGDGRLLGMQSRTGSRGRGESRERR